MEPQPKYTDKLLVTKDLPKDLPTGKGLADRTLKPIPEVVKSPECADYLAYGRCATGNHAPWCKGCLGDACPDCKKEGDHA